MKHYCDYDSIIHYEPGAFNSKYKTYLHDKLQEIERCSYDRQITGSFRNGEYRTYRTTKPVILYRVFGLYHGEKENSLPRGARLRGGFASTEFAESIIDAKLRLALDPAWFNTKMYEAKISVPSGTVISVGVVAKVTLSTGTILPGGADQILLPYMWPEEWIIGYRHLGSRQLQSIPFYSQQKPNEYDTKETLYRPGCPACGCENVRKLALNERFTITGKKGNQYTMQYTCLNPECRYYW